jgi:hypothetical protein
MHAAPLPENLPFAYAGEVVDERLVVGAQTARRWLNAHNPTGHPNADVLRQSIGATKTGRRHLRWIIDFPHPPRDARRELYRLPCAALPQPPPPWKPGHELRFLACPARNVGGFEWVESTLLPDSSLVVWARDDDFSCGVLNSALFAQWLEAHDGAVLTALRSFPFPWAPGTPLGSLSREQEEHRHAIAKAARAGDAEAINTTAAQAYGWQAAAPPAELFAHLHQLHQTRLSSIR